MQESVARISSKVYRDFMELEMIVKQMFQKKKMVVHQFSNVVTSPSFPKIKKKK